jgi:hypothetical protein
MNTLTDIHDEPIITVLTPAEMDKLAHVGGRAARAHRIIARVLLGGLAFQLFFAGLGVFGVYGFLPHAIMGASVILASFSLPLIAWRGRLDRSRLRRSLLLAGLMILQGLLIDLGRIWPIVAAFHPVNAMLLVLLTFSLM